MPLASICRLRLESNLKIKYGNIVLMPNYNRTDKILCLYSKSLSGVFIGAVRFLQSVDEL